MNCLQISLIFSTVFFVVVQVDAAVLRASSPLGLLTLPLKHNSSGGAFHEHTCVSEVCMSVYSELKHIQQFGSPGNCLGCSSLGIILCLPTLINVYACFNGCTGNLTQLDPFCFSVCFFYYLSLTFFCELCRVSSFTHTWQHVTNFLFCFFWGTFFLGLNCFLFWVMLLV